MQKKSCLYRLLILFVFLFVTVCCLCTVAKQAELTSSQGEEGTYVDEKITVPVVQIADPETVTTNENQNSLNFGSPTVSEDIKNYLVKHINYPKGYTLSFSFSYTKDGTIANIHLGSVLEKEFNSTENYTSRIYGDICKRDGLADNQIYVSDNATTGGLRAELISNTKDGKYLVKIYDLIKNIGKSHTIEIPPYEKDAEFSSFGGMYYGGKVYIAQ